MKVDIRSAAEIRVKTETLLIVNYTAGYNPIPETIYTAIAMIVGYLYDRAKYMNFDRIRMLGVCLLYTSPSPRDLSTSRMPSSA